ncbi:hypothetical protein CLOSTMETH_00802 [[Clostridium] methylpentosum DSM 5476]|uniref:ECF transporter S component n=1 Tax=[Clostridium] methylpentosum DSM 5476 TaxID=537013 RepID=C0EAE7_9FIRM|nr:hypothetical protein CLOSTMETH_00802 [[Clostridium] methylpentosum DSM 5476]MDY3989199.1 ECF transporter S component [Massilioclostridium sp.]
MNTTIDTRIVRNKSITMLLAVAVSVLLPQLFHAVGAVSGLGAALGSTFLPMHLPVLLAGLIAGPVVGVAAGAASPLLSFALSGMPAAAMLPFMMIELAGYGLAAGLLSKVNLPVFVKVVIAQLAGRLVRAAALLFAIYAVGNTGISVAQTWNIVLTGLPGILLQWALIPLLLYRLDGVKKYYE